jgi:glucose/arabinose dehydrogenase
MSLANESPKTLQFFCIKLMGMNRRGRVVLILIGLLAIALIAWTALRVREGAQPASPNDESTSTSSSDEAPKLAQQAVLSGLSNPWDVGFLSDETLLLTERSGTISKLEGGKKVVLLTVPNVYAKGEGGLMGFAVDPDFATNRYVYACYDTPEDIRVSRWEVNADATSLSDQTNIVTGLPVNTKTFPGRHSGCRPRFGADGYLWIGTGDAAIGTNPQDPGSLGGKILHVDRNGKAAPGNQNPPFDARIYSYGHRNVQGLAMLPSPKYGVYGFSVEHGPGKDDEVNALGAGNFGWNPVPGYNEQIPMTDKRAYPEAIDAVWRSGNSTLAPSGATFLLSSKWRAYTGRIAMAVLKDEHVRLLELDDSGRLKTETELFKGEFGRIRSAVLGPDGDLYLTTDNGSGRDKIVRITPQ